MTCEGCEVLDSLDTRSLWNIGLPRHFFHSNRSGQKKREEISLGGAVLTRFCHRNPHGLRGRTPPGPGLLAALEGPVTGACPGTILIGNRIREARGCIWCTRAYTAGRYWHVRSHMQGARGVLVDAHAGDGWCAVILKARAHRPWRAGGACAGVHASPRAPAENEIGPTWVLAMHTRNRPAAQASG